MTELEDANCVLIKRVRQTKVLKIDYCYFRMIIPGIFIALNVDANSVRLVVISTLAESLTLILDIMQHVLLARWC